MLLWKDDVEDKDFDAARAYLSLRIHSSLVDDLVARLKKAEITHRRVNDILRATGRNPLPFDDPGVEKGLHKAVKGEYLSPVLIVLLKGGDSDIADGFHRVSLAYRLDPFSFVPCRIA